MFPFNCDRPKDRPFQRSCTFFQFTCPSSVSHPILNIRRHYHIILCCCCYYCDFIGWKIQNEFHFKNRVIHSPHSLCHGPPINSPGYGILDKRTIYCCHKRQSSFYLTTDDAMREKKPSQVAEPFAMTENGQWRARRWEIYFQLGPEKIVNILFSGEDERLISWVRFYCRDDGEPVLAHTLVSYFHHRPSVRTEPILTEPFVASISLDESVNRSFSG